MDNKQPTLQGITVQSAAFSSSSGNLPELTPQEEPSPQSLPSLSGTLEASGQRARAVLLGAILPSSSPSASLGQGMGDAFQNCTEFRVVSMSEFENEGGVAGLRHVNA